MGPIDDRTLVYLRALSEKAWERDEQAAVLFLRKLAQGFEAEPDAGAPVAEPPPPRRPRRKKS